ncbi:MAG TPA: ArsR family transcriptional regulator [Anaerolineae bacterium]|nr:ArsR family transcriptional regulator [Anaerolineae bacterium]
MHSQYTGGEGTMLGNPVRGEAFYDRVRLLDLLTCELQGFLRQGTRSHLALIGPRKAGKTSLLFELQRRFEGQDIFMLYLYLKPEPSRLFLHRFLISLLADFLRRQGRPVDQVILPTRPNLEALMQQAISLLPGTVAKIMEITRQTDVEEQLFSLFLLLGVFQQEIGLPLVVMLDEFQRLAGYQAGDVFDHFREVIAAQEQVLYLIAGSAVGMMMDIVADKAAPLFGHFRIHHVGTFDYEDARFFLLDKIKGVVNLKENHLNFLIDLTEGFPFYLDVLAHRITLLAGTQGLHLAPRSLITQALVEEVFLDVGTIYQYLRETIEESIVRRGMGTYLALLSAIAQGHNTVSQLARHTGMQMPAIPHYLRRMMDAHLIQRRDRRYLITDKLMAFWLKYVYALREESYVTELETSLQHFKSQVDALIAAYKSELGLAREAQIREIFARDEGFTNVRGGTLQGQEFDLIAWRRDTGALWLGEIKTTPLDRVDLHRFEERVAALGPDVTVERKVALALAGYNEAAAHFAAEHDIELWDLRRVNEARERFGLHPICL